LVRLIYVYAATVMSLGFIVALYLCIRTVSDLCSCIEDLAMALGGAPIG